MKKYNLVYKITNVINDMIYIGVHSTDNIEDGYMGSGSLLKKHIKEFGIESFKREILFNYDNRKEALNKEEELVNIDFLKDKNVYNLILGGNKGIKTTKEKRSLFNKNAKEVIINKNVKIDYSPVNKEYIYIIKPKNDYPIINKVFYNNKLHKKLVEFLDNNIVRFYRALSYCYNDNNHKNHALKMIKKANEYVGFNNNWQIVKYKVDILFWDELNKSEDVLNQYYSR